MSDRIEVRYWIAVAVSVFGLLCAKLFGVQLSWIVVLAPLWLPPVLFFWFAAIATVVASIAMSKGSEARADGKAVRWPTVRDRLVAWLSSRSRGNTNLSVAVMIAAHTADTAQAAVVLLG